MLQNLFNNKKQFFLDVYYLKNDLVSVISKLQNYRQLQIKKKVYDILQI